MKKCLFLMLVCVNVFALSLNNSKVKSIFEIEKEKVNETYLILLDGDKSIEVEKFALNGSYLDSNAFFMNARTIGGMNGYRAADKFFKCGTYYPVTFAEGLFVLNLANKTQREILFYPTSHAEVIYISASFGYEDVVLDILRSFYGSSNNYENDFFAKISTKVFDDKVVSNLNNVSLLSDDFFTKSSNYLSSRLVDSSLKSSTKSVAAILNLLGAKSGQILKLDSDNEVFCKVRRGEKFIADNLFFSFGISLQTFINLYSFGESEGKNYALRNNLVKRQELSTVDFAEKVVRRENNFSLICSDGYITFTAVKGDLKAVLNKLDLKWNEVFESSELFWQSKINNSKLFGAMAKSFADVKFKKFSGKLATVKFPKFGNYSFENQSKPELDLANSGDNEQDFLAVDGVAFMIKNELNGANCGRITIYQPKNSISMTNFLLYNVSLCAFTENFFLNYGSVKLGDVGLCDYRISLAYDTGNYEMQVKKMVAGENISFIVNGLVVIINGENDLLDLAKLVENYIKTL